MILFEWKWLIDPNVKTVTNLGHWLTLLSIYSDRNQPKPCKHLNDVWSPMDLKALMEKHQCSSRRRSNGSSRIFYWFNEFESEQAIHSANGQILDPTKITFRFSDFEIIPTLEEISQIANLPLVGWIPLAPQATLGNLFLRSLVLRVGLRLRIVEVGWVSLGYLFKRYVQRENYDRF